MTLGYSPGESKITESKIRGYARLNSNVEAINGKPKLSPPSLVSEEVRAHECFILQSPP